MKNKLIRLVFSLVILGTMLGFSARHGMVIFATESEEDEEEDDGEDDEDEDDEEEEERRRLKEQEEALEQQRDHTMDAIGSIKSSIESVQAQIDQLKGAKSNLQTYINQLDKQVNQLEEQIRKLDEEIRLQTEKIEKKEQEIEELEAERQTQYEMMKKRICYMYENGMDSVLTLILESGSISEMMNRAEYAVEMSDYDKRMAQQMLETQQEIEEQKEELEAVKKEQENLLAQLDEEKEAVDKAIDAKTQEIAAYQSQINSASASQGDYQAQLLEQEKLLEQIETQIAAVAAARAAAGDGDGGASGFLWPCPISHRITSSFGPRSAPVPGASTYHKGVDIGAPTGSSIVAAASGRVTTATYSGSAGNYVVISHGNGISTVYMHASALYVSEGDIVGKGQTIAAVGSTGYSSGPHLHFGVIVNGSYVNPLNYVQ